MHQIRYFGTHALLRFEMRAAQEEWCRRLKPNFTLLDPLVKIGEGWGRILNGRIKYIVYDRICGIHLIGICYAV